jgi:SynChlorMet cassette radical SAM/SPASM protein ScmE
MDLAITNECNLMCKYCGHFASAGDTGQDLPKEEWLNFFEELNHCRVTKVTISGGEPFCRKDLKELVEGIVRNRMRFIILSNGTLITEDTAAFLASTGRCERVQVSIDGSTPIAHDAFRGRGSFLKALRGIKALQKHHLRVSARVTIHRQNCKDLEDVAKFLFEEVGLPGFSTNAASYMGRCRQNAEQVQLTAEERSLAIETLLKLDKKYNGRISATAGPLSEGRGWLMMEKARQEGKEYVPGRGHLASCSALMSKIAVRADGIMIPCAHLGHIELGRINQDDLQDVWQNHPELGRLRERCNTPLDDFEFCRGCEYINYCTGGCPALAYTILGNAYYPSPASCLRQFLEKGGRLPKEVPNE